MIEMHSDFLKEESMIRMKGDQRMCLNEEQEKKKKFQNRSNIKIKW